MLKREVFKSFSWRFALFASCLSLCVPVQAHVAGFESSNSLETYKLSSYYDAEVGSHLADAGQYGQAIHYFAKAVEKNPTSVLNQYNLGYSEMMLAEIITPGDDKEQVLFQAEWAMQRARDLNPDMTLTYFKLGKLAIERGDYSQATQYYKEGAENNPDSAALWFNLGAAYEKIKDPEQAEQAYLKAIEQNPKFVYAHNNLGLLYEQTNRTAQAEEIYKKALEEMPDYNFARLNLGSLLQGMGRIDEAKLYYREALKYEPDNPWAYLYLGNINYTQGNYQEALEAYNKAISLNPDYPTTYYLACLTLQKLNRTDEALANGLHYINLAPEGAFSQEAGEIIMTLKQQSKPKTSSTGQS